MEVGLEDELDSQAVLGRRLEIRTDVPTGIDNNGPSGRWIPDQVGRLRQAIQIVLLKDHVSVVGGVDAVENLHVLDALEQLLGLLSQRRHAGNDPASVQ